MGATPKMNKLPVAVSTTEFYLAAMVEEMRALVAGVDALVAAVVATGAPTGAGEMVGLDEERLLTLLASIKGIGDVTARRIVDSYKSNVGQ